MSNSEIDRFIDYAARFNPGFPSAIRGATERELQELTQLVGAPLPDVYTDFLMRMGHDDGGLSLAMEGTTDISQVIAYYRDCLSEDPAPFPADCVVMGTGRISGDVCLECVVEKVPRVVFTEDVRITGLYADSFVGLLYRSVFEVFRLSATSFSAQYVASYAHLGMRSVLGVARQVAVEIGFREQWFSDSVVFCGEMPGVAIAITQYQRQGMGVFVAAEERGDVERIGRVFVERFGLVPAR